MVQDYITGLDESMIGSDINMIRIDEYDYDADLVFTNFFDVDVNYHAPKGTWLPLNGSPD